MITLLILFQLLQVFALRASTAVAATDGDKTPDGCPIPNLCSRTSRRTSDNPGTSGHAERASWVIATTISPRGVLVTADAISIVSYCGTGTPQNVFSSGTGAVKPAA